MQATKNEFFEGVEVKKNESLFRRMLEILPTAAFTLDSEGLVTYFNPTAEKLLGRAPLVNNPIDKFLGSFKIYNSEGILMDHNQTWMAKSLLVDIDFKDHEIIIEQPDGPGKHFLANSNPIYNDDGTLFGVVNILVDITYQKHIEDEKRRIESQHLHSQKFESLGVLAGGIAHDFNNLLTVIQGNASLAIMETDPNSKIHKFLTNIEGSTQSASRLTKQMLAYSGKGQFIVEAIELDNLILEMTDLLKTVIPKKVDVHYNLNSACIIGDKTEIRQIIMNLVTNAAEAMASKTGAIEISTGTKHMIGKDLFSPQFPTEKSSGSYAYLIVKDSGYGMNDNILPKIFDPFFSTKFTGRGLGLAATMGIVRGHQGVINVTSTVYEGSTFEVLIPAHTATIKGKIKSIENVSSQKDNARSILVVDDDDNILSFISEALETGGFIVYSATNGSEALAIFDKYKDEISGLVLDVSMDQMDGFELLEKLRSKKAGIAALIMSGYSENEVFSENPDRERISFIQKPMSIASLIASVQELTIPAK